MRAGPAGRSLPLRPRRLLRWPGRMLRRGYSQLVDLALGVRTTPAEPHGLLAPIDPDLVSTRPCGWLTLLRVFRRLDIRADDVLLDIGCGAGRAVLLAGLFGPRRVIGLEASEPLLAQARRNAGRFRFRRGGSPALVLGDARSFPTPDEVTIVLMYNPFTGETFDAAMKQVYASFERVQRNMTLVYINPIEHEFLVNSGRWRLVDRIGGPRPTKKSAAPLTTHVYRLAGPAEAGGGGTGR